MKKKKCGVLAAIFLAVVSCVSYDLPKTYTYKQPLQLNDGFESISVSENKSDLEIINTVFSRIYSGQYGKIHSVLAAFGNNLFLEEYLPGNKFFGPKIWFTADTPHNMASVTKSITSILIGIALDKGFISDVNDSIMDYFPEYSQPDRTSKEKITIKHLLTMTAGFEWDEHSYTYRDKRNDTVRLHISKDPIKYVLSKRIIHTPGAVFRYNGGCTNLLGEILYRSSGMKADKFARKYLFGSMGIHGEKWSKLKNNIVYTSGDLRLKPRDLLKLGLLYLNKGLWDGKRIVSESWVEESTKSYIKPGSSGLDGYGYQWLVSKRKNPGGVPQPMFSAVGWGGQYLVVVPEIKFISVITAGNYDIMFDTSRSIAYDLMKLEIWNN